VRCDSLEKGDGVECSGGFVLVLEVDVDVAVLRKGEEVVYEGSDLFRAVGSGASQTEAGVCGCGVHFGCGEVIAFRDAEGSVVIAEDGVDLLAEPSLVTEFEGDGRGSGGAEGWGFEECCEACGVGFEIGWKLKEDEAEFGGLTHGLKSGEKEGYVFGAVGEALDVGDSLWSFEAEAEEWLCGGEPVLEHLCGWQGSEGVVDFDGAELSGVELEEFFSGRGGGVENGLPGGIGPTGSSCEDASGGGCGCNLGRG